MTNELRDDGGSAFPNNPHSLIYQSDGMTLRDYFAAKAMAAMLPQLLEEQSNPKAYKSAWAEMLANGSYVFADAMLKARAQ